MDTSRVNEIESRLMDALRRLAIAESRIAALSQAQAAGGGGIPNSNGGSGGAYYADPGSTVVAAGDSEDLDVMEARADGDRVVGTKTVLNYYSADTAADLRLFLAKCGDGSYLIVGQDCPAPGGG